ncbi:hypothetical protein CBFG_01594 [Clostridiales bacterium 1_7_47FAA]|nr:hypothetical protein CBFG_01594 [Clostridiales bacterium 1_7_47FAA]
MEKTLLNSIIKYHLILINIIKYFTKNQFFNYFFYLLPKENCLALCGLSSFLFTLLT